MNYFENFAFKELFIDCSDAEILSCVKCNGVDNLLYLLAFLQDFRQYSSIPVRITSTFRDVEHNKRVGGSPLSQHLLGAAIDFQPINHDFGSFVLSFKDFLEVSSLKLYIGQVFIYSSFIHIGLRTANHKNLQIYDKRKN